VKKLHALGLNGSGVDIAIIDQTTLATHVEYKDNIKMLINLGNPASSPQMHGPFVISIAAGKTCGVAPNANVYYFSTPMWEDNNSYYIQAIKRVIELNESGTANIKAISISTGMFQFYSEFDEFQNVVLLAESKGIVVLTCAERPFAIPTASIFNTGILSPLSGYKGEHPSDFTIQGYSGVGINSLLVPGDNCTFASEKGNIVYTHSVNGGRSYAPPWLAGLVAIGFQVNPKLTPENVKNFLLDSAWKMPYGTVVNPEKFVEMCKSNKPH
jgi:hypothetical protein